MAAIQWRVDQFQNKKVLEEPRIFSRALPVYHIKPKCKDFLFWLTKNRSWMPKWGYYSMNLLGTQAQLHRSLVHTHTQTTAIRYTLPVCSVSVAVRKKLYNDYERGRSKRWPCDFWKKNSSSVTGIPLRSVLVNMDRINHIFPYSNRRIPEHANFVAMTQSLKGV